MERQFYFKLSTHSAASEIFGSATNDRTIASITAGHTPLPSSLIRACRGHPPAAAARRPGDLRPERHAPNPQRRHEAGGWLSRRLSSGRRREDHLPQGPPRPRTRHRHVPRSVGDPRLGRAHLQYKGAYRGRRSRALPAALQQGTFRRSRRLRRRAASARLAGHQVVAKSDLSSETLFGETLVGVTEAVDRPDSLVMLRRPFL